jgi:hypothetical protein
MSNGYVKLFGSILDSSVWREDKETRLVWITMLAMKDKYGLVHAAIPGLADRAKVSIDECLKAISTLESPDKWSRSKEHEGRRIESVPGGWKVLNHEHYRQLLSEDDRREKNRTRMATKRAATKGQRLGALGIPVPITTFKNLED